MENWFSAVIVTTTPGATLMETTGPNSFIGGALVEMVFPCGGEIDGPGFGPGACWALSETTMNTTRTIQHSP
jgi:hypothetical protein